MRASSLSNDKVIDLLNHFFVPVYLSNEDFAKGGCAPAEERKELQRIFRETLDAKRSAGSVHVYILAPDGKSFDSMHVASAAKVEKLVPMLEAAVAQHKLTAGRTCFRPARSRASPKTAPDALVLHLVARNVVKQGDDLVPTQDQARRDALRRVGVVSVGRLDRADQGRGRQAAAGAARCKPARPGSSMPGWPPAS